MPCWPLTSKLKILLLDKRAQAGCCPGCEVKYWRQCRDFYRIDPNTSAMASDDIMTVREAVSMVVWLAHP
jgi:hypothetical protein